VEGGGVTKWPATLLEVEGFLGGLDDERIRKIWEYANAVVLESADTLSDEFQIAATVKMAINDYIKERLSASASLDSDHSTNLLT
jgi:hypothetical protein